MAAATNIQMNLSTATPKNQMRVEDGDMDNRIDNINVILGIRESFRRGSIMKMAAGAALGLALTLGVAMPGTASADAPLVTAPRSADRISMLNDDFSMVYGVPDNGPGHWVTGASAKVKVNAKSVIYNDDFSMVYGIPDVGSEPRVTGTTAPAKVRVNAESVNYNDDFSLVYGIPDVGLEPGAISTSAPAKVGVNAKSVNYNDDFSLVYGIPDVGLELGGAAGSSSSYVKGYTRIQFPDVDDYDDLIGSTR